MRLVFSFITLLLLIFSTIQADLAQSQSKTYSETRQWLVKMERHSSNKQLKKLFEEADIRMPDLIQALDDSDVKICLNSQVIIKYLDAPEGMQALNEWYQKQKDQHKSYSMPILELLSNKKYLEGKNSDLSKLIENNKHLFEASAFNSGDVSIKVIAYNKRVRGALVEVVQGEVFTAGWHAVIKQEGDEWYLVSDNNVWVH